MYSRTVKFKSPIRELRKQKKITREQLAKMADLSTDTVKNIERGVNVPNVLAAIRMSKVLGCPVESLFHELA